MKTEREGKMIEAKEVKHKEGWYNCICPICGMKFHKKPSHINKSKISYCSKECHREAKKEYMKGERNHQYGVKGSKNSSWKSDRRISRYGYIQVRVLDHPFREADDFVFEHRLIAEKYLLDDNNSIEINGKRYLKNGYIVHHKNFDRQDNRVENLEVMTKEEHQKYHANLNHSIKDTKTGRFVKKIGCANPKRVTGSATVPERLHTQKEIYGLNIDTEKTITIPPYEYALLETNETFNVRKGNVGAIYWIHGVDENKAYDPHNCIGVFGSGDRGTIKLSVYNNSDKEIMILPHERVARIVFNKTVDFEMEII